MKAYTTRVGAACSRPSSSTSGASSCPSRATSSAPPPVAVAAPAGTTHRSRGTRPASTASPTSCSPSSTCSRASTDPGRRRLRRRGQAVRRGPRLAVRLPPREAHLRGIPRLDRGHLEGARVRRSTGERAGVRARARGDQRRPHLGDRRRPRSRRDRAAARPSGLSRSSGGSARSFVSGRQPAYGSVPIDLSMLSRTSSTLASCSSGVTFLAASRDAAEDLVADVLGLLAVERLVDRVLVLLDEDPPRACVFSAVAGEGRRAHPYPPTLGHPMGCAIALWAGRVSAEVLASSPCLRCARGPSVRDLRRASVIVGGGCSGGPGADSTARAPHDESAVGPRPSRARLDG